MSWIRSLGADFDRQVAFYYSLARESDGLYLDEIGGPAPSTPRSSPTSS